ncbi:MAG: ATP-dependent Clp protease proteolytic subunit [Sphingomonadales bacterium]|nr:ATP-dependent Clp protease proteolytic subunit [Sphingomonadales bacterium]
MNFSKEFDSFARGHLGMHAKAVEGGLSRQLQGFTPYIIEERPMNIASMDVFSRLMMDRIIFMGVGVTNEVANIIQAQLLFLDSVDSSRDIQIYINSPGGSVYAGLGIYDTMQFISADVATICTGMAASMGAVLLCAGAPGKRTALKHARVMIHQPMSGMQGQVTEMEIALKETLKVRDELYQILADHSGQSVEKITNDSDRDYWMSATEAKEYGMIDDVLVKNPKAKSA